ncbi:MAG: HypC/HybG/HupF family hydrogenase formation chaperone [Actinomycetes bacterium]
MCLGIPGQVVAIADVAEQRVIAQVEGVRREVSSALLGIRTPDGVVAVGDASGDEAVSVGDWVLIHVGFAMSRIDEEEAAETLKALKMFAGEFEQEIAEFAGDESGWDPYEAVGFVTPHAARAERPAPAGPADPPRPAPATPRAAPATPRNDGRP